MTQVLKAMIERAGARVPSSTGAAADPDPQEHCGLCGLPVPEQHRHVLDLRRHEIHCACRACAILFDRGGAGGGHYCLIPERRRRLASFHLDDLGWRSLGIPVEMAFFVRRSENEEVSAFYPSPAGATRAEVPIESWQELESAHPAVRGIEPDVEALLVNRLPGGGQAFIVGLDDCYRLVAVVREHWRGFSGGENVWSEIERFFGELDARAEVVT